jgi:hypothetical protein
MLAISLRRPSSATGANAVLAVSGMPREMAAACASQMRKDASVPNTSGDERP